jgi:hypothetical protein
MAEVHLIIVWSKGVSEKDKIISDVKTKFVILEKYYITWTEENFSKNLSRFYGENLPKNSRKEKHCGAGTFLCLVVLDKTPKYDVRQTSKGDKVVNVNLFDVKQLYREWTGGGHKVHATDNIKETKYQLTLLLNKHYLDYLKGGSFSGKTINLKNDLVGADGWESISDIFSVLRKASNYLVLRNYENIEEEVNALHPDIDILCDDPKLFVRLINGKASTRKKYRVQYMVSVCGKPVFFDVRHVGDNYYCSRWARNLLNQRISRDNFYIPEPENHYFTLMYHALLHKPYLTNDYFKKLIILGNTIEGDLDDADFLESSLIARLTKFMEHHNYQYTVPNDRTVFWNYKLLSNVGSPSLNLARKCTYVTHNIKMIVKKILKKIVDRAA